MVEARGIAGFLQVHAVIDDVDQHLHMALRLHAAAHQAQRHERLAVLLHEGRNDGVEGPLGGFVSIGVRRIEAEQFAAVLEHEARSRRDQPAAHATIVRLDQANHHAVAIDHGKIGGVAFTLQLRSNLDLARCELGRGLGGIDQFETVRAIGVGQKFLGQGGESGIGIEARDVGIGEAFRFDHVVQGFRATALPLRQVDILEDVDHLQRCKTLRIWRQLAQFIAILVAHTGGLDPFAAVIGKVRAREGAALRLQIIDHAIGQCAVVEGVAAVAPDRLERVGKVRIGEYFAYLGCRPIGEPDLAGIAEVEFVLARRIGPERARQIHADDRCDRMAFAGIAHGRGEVVGHAALAEAFVHGEPRIDRSGHRDRQRTIGWQRLGAVELLEQLIERLVRGRAPRSVDAVQFARRGIVDDGEQVAADAVPGRLHQAQRGIGGNRRVHRIAAILEHVERDLRRERMRGRGHAMLRDYRAARPVRADRPTPAPDLRLDRGLLRRLLRAGRGGSEGEGCNARHECSHVRLLNV